jgi:hypothetical protein
LLLPISLEIVLRRQAGKRAGRRARLFRVKKKKKKKKKKQLF